MTTFHVAPHGSDTAAGTAAQPFATLPRARDAAREVAGACELIVHGGCYEQVSLVLTPADSGLTISAALGETPVLYGGRRLRGWQPIGNGWYGIALPEVATGVWDFRALVVNGRLAARARYPEEGRLRHLNEFPVRWMSSTAGGWERKPTEAELTTMRYQPGDLGPWLDVRNAEVTIYHQWDESLVGLSALDAQTQTVTFSTPAGHPPGAFADWNPEANTYVVWNVREGMTHPGQWYLDRTAGMVVYWPLPGEELDTAEVIAPTTETIIHLEGSAEQPVTDITLRGLTLTGTTTPLIAGGFGAMHFAGAVMAEHAAACTFAKLTVCQVGGHGVKLQRCREMLVNDCDVFDTGAGGIYCRGESVDNRITECGVHHVGQHYPSSIGIFADGLRLRIDHNEISDTPYTGINCGSVDSAIEYNRISRVMQVLRDGAAIYFFAGKNMRVRRNVAIDIDTPLGHGYYPDERCEGCIVEENLAVDVAWPSHNHMAAGCTLRRNVFLTAGPMRLTFMKCQGFTLEENILVAGGEILISAMLAGITAFPRNVLHSGTETVTLETLSEDGYNPLGQAPLPPRDGTVYADPQFVAAAQGDYHFRSGSPASALGIPPLDIAEAGRTRITT